MKSLLIFDEACRLESAAAGPDAVDLFPLTGDWALIEGLRGRFAAGGAPVAVLDAATAVDREVDTIRDRVGEWAAALGERSVDGRALREWFLAPGGGVSGWWFSAFSERNTVKTDVFFRLAQLRAVDRLLADRGYASCVLAVGAPRLAAALAALARRRGMAVSRAAVRRPDASFRARARDALLNAGGAGTLLHALAKFAGFLAESLRARAALGPLGSRRRFRGGALVVSYFPYVDHAAAARGEFRNLYLGPLQDRLQERERSLNWLLVPVPVEGLSFGGSVRLARAFAARGAPVHVLQEFLFPRGAVRALAAWARQAWRARRLARRLPADALTEGIAPPEADALLRPLWRESFAGWGALQGFLLFEVFRAVFERFSDSALCLYFAEMQAWEKAFLAAKARVAPGVRSIGFQHAAIARNHFFYIHAPRETRRTGAAADLPLPDVLACNGPAPRAMLAMSGYPGLREVEAVRQLRVNRLLAAAPAPRRAPPGVLVAGSIDRRETASLLALVRAAFPRPAGFTVRFRPHPAASDPALWRSRGGEGWVCAPMDEPLETALAGADVVIGGESSITIEALACGCELIVPVLNDVMFLSPLAGHEAVYHRVSGPAALRERLTAVLAAPPDLARREKARVFVRSYWNLDESLKGWEALLG